MTKIPLKCPRQPQKRRNLKRPKERKMCIKPRRKKRNLPKQKRSKLSLSRSQRPWEADAVKTEGGERNAADLSSIVSLSLFWICSILNGGYCSYA